MKCLTQRRKGAKKFTTENTEATEKREINSGKLPNQFISNEIQGNKDNTQKHHNQRHCVLLPPHHSKKNRANTGLVSNTTPCAGFPVQGAGSAYRNRTTISIIPMNKAYRALPREESSLNQKTNLSHFKT
jgi:hypothetical protein